MERVAGRSMRAQESNEESARSQASGQSLTPILLSLILVALGAAVLQGWLTMLWSNRERVGLAMPLQLELGHGDPIPHLGAWIYFFPLAILVVGALLRFYETHPQAMAGLSMRTGSPAQSVGSLLVLVALFGGVGVAAAVIEHLFIHHFASGPAHHVVILVVFLGLCFAGRRRPFLHVTFAHPLDDAGRWRRRRADFICVVLITIIYASWMAYHSLSDFEYQLDTLQAALFIGATLLPAALLGWAILHSSLVAGVSIVVGALEARGEDASSDAKRIDGWPGAAVEWVSHFGVAALMLGLGRLLWLWFEQVWNPNRSSLLLGVDWYFVSAWGAVTAAEAAIVPAALLFGGLGVHRVLVRRKSGRSKVPGE